MLASLMKEHQIRQQERKDVQGQFPEIINLYLRDIVVSKIQMQGCLFLHST